MGYVAISDRPANLKQICIGRGMFENFISEKKDIFGLDIGYDSIKVVELKKSGNFYNLVGFFEKPIPADSLQKNGILRKKEIIDILSDAVKKSLPRAITAKKIVAALPASMCFTKNITLPAMKKADLEKAVPYEVADFFPIPVSEMNLDFDIINSIKKDGKEQLEILVIGALKTLIDDFIEIASGANLDLVALETKPISAARALLSDDKYTSMLVDIGAELSSISVAERGIIKITATSKFGGNLITRDIAAALEIDNVKAENIKIESGLEIGKKDLQNNAIIKNLKFLSEEISENIKYYQTRIKKNSKIDQIILSGGGAELKHIETFFQQELNISVKQASPWSKIKLKPSDKISAASNIKFTNAIGLAMREI